MASPPENSLFGNYVKWALGVSEPMTIAYAKRKDFVKVNILRDFVTDVVCKDCDSGCHLGHIIRIKLTTEMDGSHKMKLFNYNKNDCTDDDSTKSCCIIPPDTEAFKSLQSIICARGDQRYFYGTVDEDDHSTLYINIKKLPPM